MAWYLERTGASGTRVNLTPVAGDIQLSRKQLTVTKDALNGSRRVWKAPASPVDVTIPELAFTTASDVALLEGLVTGAGPLTLGTDYGTTYPVQAVGGMQTRILDTPDRATKAEYRVTLTLTGV